MNTYSGTSQVSDVLAAVKISRVYAALTAKHPRPCGTNRFRAQATWRRGENLSVSINDSKSTWFDHAAGEGGGVLDLVSRVRGGGRRDSLRWLSEFAGVPLNDRPMSNEDGEAWVQRRREVERALPVARLWQRTAVSLGQELLYALKASLWEPAPTMQSRPSEIARLTRQIAIWRELDSDALVDEYQRWKNRDPKMTGAMVQAAKMRQTAECRALRRFLSMTAAEKTAA